MFPPCFLRKLPPNEHQAISRIPKELPNCISATSERKELVPVCSLRTRSLEVNRSLKLTKLLTKLLYDSSLSNCSLDPINELNFIRLNWLYKKSAFGELKRLSGRNAVSDERMMTGCPNQVELADTWVQVKFFTGAHCALKVDCVLDVRPWQLAEQAEVHNWMVMIILQDRGVWSLGIPLSALFIFRINRDS